MPTVSPDTTSPIRSSRMLYAFMMLMNGNKLIKNFFTQSPEQTHLETFLRIISLKVGDGLAPASKFSSKFFCENNDRSTRILGWPFCLSCCSSWSTSSRAWAANTQQPAFQLGFNSTARIFPVGQTDNATLTSPLQTIDV